MPNYPLKERPSAESTFSNVDLLATKMRNMISLKEKKIESRWLISFPKKKHHEDMDND
jgi:hypothetical protein